MTSSIPKPQGSTWTDEQWDAIRLSGQHILVAAAAGSGKTAVLVERIIRKVCDEHQPVDVDRLLVATFTKAAAAEMRQRIREALEKELQRNPKSSHLRKQLALINRAAITTLHSFCLDVIRRYFQLIELDPGFRIANETEAELLRQDLLSDLFEEYYANSAPESDFWQLVDCFSGERSDDALYKLVQQLYDYSRSHPWPDHWLRSTAAYFDVNVDNPYDARTIWQESLIVDVQLELSGIMSTLEEATRLADQPGGPAPYLANLREDLDLVRYLYEASEQTWGILYHAFQAAEFGKLKPCRGDDFDKDLQEQVKQLRNAAKDSLKTIHEQLFTRNPEVFIEELRHLAPVMKQLVEIVIEFGERYRVEKSSKGMVDFADLEHYCLHILRSPNSTPEQMSPSQAALDYQEQFVEVLLDEYQDTNMVQEAIVDLIANPSPGNRFMVGDVKQSIYRFRLAEPGLFLDKYRTYGDKAEDAKGGATAGRKIDLARNFRSRLEIVDAVNYIFKQIMHEAAAEINYDARAELVCGASYPQGSDKYGNGFSAELMLIDRSAESGNNGEFEPAEHLENDNDALEGSEQAESEEQLLETAQLEARLIATQIRKLMGEGDPAFQVYDKRIGGTRSITYRDIVILLRATQSWAPVLIEELRLQGIPAYADLNTGYFTATEVEVVLSLLKVIDNPYQDIPLAGVLRSPMFGLSAEDLAHIRILAKRGAFYDAVLVYANMLEQGDEQAQQVVLPRNESLVRKLQQFLVTLHRWRDEARQGSLPDLIWNIYRETGYFDLVGGMPGGIQRQANLRALYDRARQYEATSFRGLFRFLRVIERMKESGADLGTARALGEQEDVVRIMSIHKSKGLEFPVVFVAGLAKMFNQMDLNGNFLLHKQLGFGPKYVDTELRISYPTLPLLAIRRRMRMEMLAEEMRVLYVALTRAKEKLYLVGTVKSLDKQIASWARQLDCAEWNLPAYELAKARSYLDWIGPAMIRHPQAVRLRERGGLAHVVPAWLKQEPSQWTVTLIGSEMAALAQAAPSATFDDAGDKLAALKQTRPVEVSPQAECFQTGIEQRLQWTYPHQEAEALFSKITVTELKRLQDQRNVAHDESEWETPFLLPATDNIANLPPGRSNNAAKPDFLLRKPRFIEAQTISPTERGTVYHAVMQYVRLSGQVTLESIRETLAEMVEKQLLTHAQQQAVDPSVIVAFFTTDLGQRLLRSNNVKREVPFSYGLTVGEVYEHSTGDARQEKMMVQGVIDCLFAEEGQWILLDYKTDAVYNGRIDVLQQRYHIQIDVYAKAIQQITGIAVKEKYLYFFDGHHLVPM